MLIQRKSVLFGGLLLSISVSLFIISKIWVSAASTGSVLTTAPVSVDLSSRAGSTVSTKLQVQNNSQEPLTINVHLEEFKATGTSGQAQIFTPPANDPSLTWVHFSQTSFLAQPGAWNSVTMTIALPKQAALGYYYAVLFTPSTSPTNQPNSNVLKSANAILILLDTNSSNEHKLLQVSNFSSETGLYQYLPAIFNISINNPGNIQLIPQGDIYISRTVNGKSIATLALNNGEGNVLPGTTRNFHVQWSDGFPSYADKTIDGQLVNNKNGQPIQQLKWNFSDSFSKFRFGKYYAHLALVYSNGNQDVVQDSYVSFWVIPWGLILIVVFSIIALVLIWKLIKKYTRKLWNTLRRKER